MEEASLIREACDVEPGHIEATTVATTVSTATSPTSLSQKVWRKVGLAVAPLALLAVAYSALKPSSDANGSVHNVNGLKTVELTGTGTGTGTDTEAQSTWWDPITQCTKDFQEVMDGGLGGVAFGEFDFETQVENERCEHGEGGS